MAARAKARISEVGAALVKTATEVNGGSGFSDEYDLHLWFQRVGHDRHLLVSADCRHERAAEPRGCRVAGPADSERAGT